MSIEDIITEAVHQWRDEGYVADTVLLHPKNYNDLRRHIYETSFRYANPLTGPTTADADLELNCRALVTIKVAVQEAEDTFLLADKNLNTKLFFIEDRKNVRINKDKKTLIATHSELFLIRDAKNRFLVEDSRAWSVALLQQVSQNYDQTVIFNDIHSPEKLIWPKISLKSTVKSLGISNIYIVSFNNHQRLEAIQIWKEAILNVGGRLGKFKNLNDVTPYAVRQITSGDHLVWADADGNKKLGIIPEKVKSFLDLAKEREALSNW